MMELRSGRRHPGFPGAESRCEHHTIAIPFVWGAFNEHVLWDGFRVRGLSQETELPWGNRDLPDRGILGPALSLTLSVVSAPITSPSTSMISVGVFPVELGWKGPKVASCSHKGPSELAIDVADTRILQVAGPAL